MYVADTWTPAPAPSNSDHESLHTNDKLTVHKLTNNNGEQYAHTIVKSPQRIVGSTTDGVVSTESTGITSTQTVTATCTLRDDAVDIPSVGKSVQATHKEWTRF